MLLWLLSVFDPTCRTWADTTYRIKQNTSYLYRPQRSWGKVMFLHVSVILFTGGGSSGPHPGEVEGSGWGAFPGPHQGGISRPTPGGVSPGKHLGGGLQVHTRGVSQHALRQTPNMQLLLRAVRILLECILVYFVFLHRKPHWVA